MGRVICRCSGRCYYLSTVECSGVRSSSLSLCPDDLIA